MKDSDIDAEIWLLQSKGLKFKDLCHPNDYMGVNITKTNDEQYVLTQPSLIDAIIRYWDKTEKVSPHECSQAVTSSFGFTAT